MHWLRCLSYFLVIFWAFPLGSVRGTETQIKLQTVFLVRTVLWGLLFHVNWFFPYFGQKGTKVSRSISWVFFFSEYKIETSSLNLLTTEGQRGLCHFIYFFILSCSHQWFTVMDQEKSYTRKENLVAKRYWGNTLLWDSCL